MTKAQTPEIGVGFKPEHFTNIANDKPDLSFFEVHAENYMGDGGPPHAMLRALDENYDLSIHGVGLSIGSDGPLDRPHLMRLKKLVDRYQPKLVSEHLAWSSHDTERNMLFLNDLLPIPYTQRTLNRVVEHVDQIQETLGRTLLMENPSTYVAFSETEMDEISFITEMQKRTDCRLILDVNNVHISANNQKLDAYQYLDRFPLHAVGEIHLAGHATDTDDDDAPLLIDSHDRPVAPPVWELYRYLVKKAGIRPTLIEWDNDVPDWPTLYAEAVAARETMLTQTGETSAHALA